MTTIPILDLIAGMIFIYFLMSIISNSAFEGFSALRRIRAKMLEAWIIKTLPGLTDHFLGHSLLNGMSEKGKATAYMSSANFSAVLIDAIAKKAGKTPQTLRELSTMIDQVVKENADLIPDDLERALQLFVAEAQQAAVLADQTKTEFELFRVAVEKWFDSMMERLTGTYKRYAAVFTFVIAFAVTFALNIDSISLAKYLYSNEDARNKLAQAAYQAADDSTYENKVKKITTKETSSYSVDSSSGAITQIKTEIKSADSTRQYLASFIPVGWNLEAEQKVFDVNRSIKKGCNLHIYFWLQKICGLLITVFAVCLGAPFWFDVLGKVANLRNTLKPADKEEKPKK